MCAICGKPIEGRVEMLTAIVGPNTGAEKSHKSHFYCYYPQGPKSNLPLPGWALAEVRNLDPNRVIWFYESRR